MKRILLFLSIAFTLSISLSLRGGTSSWDKMVALYHLPKSYSMTIGVTIYERGNSNTLSYHGNVKYSGGQMFYAMEGMTTLVNSAYWLYIDDGNKSILYCKRDKGENKSKEQNVIAMIDSLQAKSAKPLLKGKSGSDDLYELKGDKVFYDRIEMVVSPDGYLKKIIYYYTTSDDTVYNRTEISYSNIELNTVIPAQAFSESQFIVFKNGKANPVGKYAGYKIIDQKASIPTPDGK